jgi:hypothetical protein
MVRTRTRIILYCISQEYLAENIDLKRGGGVELSEGKAVEIDSAAQAPSAAPVDIH